MQTDKIILGIDPGTNIMGYGIIHVKSKKMELLQMGVLHLSKLSSHELKLKRIFERTLQLVDEYKPDELAVEAPFFGKNVQSMLKLGRAQGVAMSAALYRNVPIFEYAPKKIKMSITGNGNASKEQVAAAICYLAPRGIPIVPWGNGTGVMGGASPHRGGVVIDLRYLNYIFFSLEAAS